MRMKAGARCAARIATILAAALVADAQNFQLTATPNQYEFNNTLWASSASSPNDIWAVGNTTIHFDGMQWKMFPAPGANDDPSAYLRGVLTFSPTLAWSGGGGDKQGQIINKWNGKKWKRLKNLPFEPTWLPSVMTLSASSPNDIWVTGSIFPNQNYQLFFEHWNGKSWGNESFLPGGVAFLYGASQDSTNDAWAVGIQLIENFTAPLVVQYDGSNWSQASLPFPPGTSELLGVLALAPNNVWAVGWQNPGNPDYYTNLTLIYHFDGNNWTIVPSPGEPGTNLNGIVANSSNDMYAFGYSANSTDTGFDTLLLHWDGSEWTIIPSPNPMNDPNFIFDQLLTGVVPSPGNVWIFGSQFDSQQGVCTDGSCTLAINTTSGK